MKHENPKHKQADGPAFGRLRVAQQMRERFKTLCKQSHPSSEIYIDQVREYAGTQIVFYRASSMHWEQARVAVFKKVNDNWSKENDIIASIDSDF